MDYWTRQKRLDLMSFSVLRMMWSSVTFLYRHSNLFAVALISASFVAIQEWYNTDYTDVPAILILLTQLWLFSLIMTTLSGHSLNSVLERSYWEEARRRVKAKVKETSSARLMTELLFLFVLIISLGNFLVLQITTLLVMVLPTSKPEAFPALRWFLACISIIPIGAIYTMMILGIDKPYPNRKSPR